MHQIIKSILSLSDDIRYVAVYNNNELVFSSKVGTARASSSESDKYEELLVNPTILTLVKQRGDIDCGGAKFVLIRYGNFYQILIPSENGHISICIEPQANPLNLIAPIMKVLKSSIVN